MGGKTDLDRVVAYVSSERKKELEEWAEAEERSVSWLVAKLIDKALQERRSQQAPACAEAIRQNHSKHSM
ncbi:CopG family transcriptional regulator [Phormidium tenue FACHB-886]|nr:CopG family transcriptional regulator [Phormidium tenue FACHB-886]